MKQTGRSVAGSISSVEEKRGRPYTDKQRKFLKLYASNNFQDAKGCAMKAGYSRHTYARALSGLKDDILEITNNMLMFAAPTAAMTMTDMLTSDKPVPNAQTKLSAAKEVLDRVGVVKPEKHDHTHTVKGGLFFLPVKQEQAGEIIDGEYEDA